MSGLMFRSRVNGEVVIVQMPNGSLAVQQGDMASRQVVDVASPQPPPASSQGGER